MSDVRQAVEFVRLGNKAEARKVLKSVLKQDRDNEQAWLVMASCAQSQQELERCAKEVLRINPDNVTALKLLAKLNIQPEMAQEEALEDVFEDPHVTQLARSTAELPVVKSGSDQANQEFEAELEAAPARSRTLFWIATFVIVVALFVGVVMIAVLVGTDDETISPANATSAAEIEATNDAIGTAAAGDATRIALTLAPATTQSQ